MNTERNAHSHIFTNRGGNILMKEFAGMLLHNPQIKNLDVVVGFLRASGYLVYPDNCKICTNPLLIKW